MADSETPTANILGTIGTVCWCIQLVPQIIHNYKRKNCEGLQPLMLFLWAACGVPFSIYFVSRNSSIPIQIQPQIFTALSLVTWAQSLYYPPIEKPSKTVSRYVLLFVLVALGLEIGFIIPLKRLYSNGVQWPSFIFGVIASVLLALGLLPPYFELIKRKGKVVGINFLFLTLDFSGAFFSALSLAFAKKIDKLGIVLYCIVGLLELGIFTSHFIWWLRYGRREAALKRREENEEEIQLATAQTKVDDSEDKEEKKYDQNLSQLVISETSNTLVPEI